MAKEEEMEMSAGVVVSTVEQPGTLMMELTVL
jgi:hypothetical protein